MGASAGGLEAFLKFFARIPPDNGMAFILVQHFDPRHETLLPELLRKSTSMSVEQVKDETPVQADHVYVIPASSTLTIEGGILRVARADSKRPPMPIDSLFYSLAEDQGHNAVCVLFSGSGSDGTLGLRAVKEHGGMAMAQTPESAQHDPMLRSAISTGLVDHVLPPEELAAKLMEYATYLRSFQGKQGQAMLTGASDEVSQICLLLQQKTGHDFSRYKTTTLGRRIQRRMQVLQLDSVPGYVERLLQDPLEADRLFRDLLIGVTHFFRDPEGWDLLAKEIVPKIVQFATTEGSLRVWTPGCATGEEAYSAAILFKEELSRRHVRPKVQIFAGDIDDEALAFGRLAHYPEGIAEHVTPARLERFFVRQGSSYVVGKEIREMCIFSTHNLIKDPPFSRMDLIICRNLLIYLEVDLQRHVTNVFHYALRRGGYLFLGPSEHVVGPPDLFQTQDRKHRIYQRGETITRPVLAIPLIAPVIASRAATSGTATRALIPGQPDVLAALQRVLLEQFSPVWVVINAASECLYFSLRTGKYLEPAAGVPSNDIVGMARPGLRLELRTAIHKAIKTGQVVTHEGIAVATNDEVQRIDLVVRPLPELGEHSRLFLVVFQELGPPTNRAQAVAEGTAPHPAGEAIMQQLESELRSTREDLQATVEELETSNEELKSSNEELLSTNEELQSSNEELQTSKEELQSVNEELETINAELNKKVFELDRSNSDMENLFRGTQVPILFLDNELRIKRFTAAATEVLRLIETDVGRPITDIAPRYLDDLTADMKDVLRTLAPRECHVRLADGSAVYLLRILPYRRVDNVIDGLVLAFANVTPLEQALAQRARLAAIVESAHDAIVSRTLDGTITSWNEAATRMFGYSEQEALGNSISLILPEGRAELEHHEAELMRGEHVGPFESIRVTKDGRRLPVMVALSPVRDTSGRIVGSSGIFLDLSAVKHAQSLREAARRKDQFLAVLSHELRGPIASLRICTNLLQTQGSGGPQFREAVQIADRQLEHLAALVDQLLDASRVATGRIVLDRSDRDLVEVVRTSAGDQRAVLKAAGIELVFELPPEPVWVNCDPLRLSQIVLNLLANAAKFSHKGGLAVVTVRRDDERHMAELIVQDDGVGIEPERLSLLFQPFTHVDLGHYRELGGLGLGLALVHALVTGHGGTVEARSEGRDRGAAFIVRLPLVGEAAAAAVQEEPAPAAHAPLSVMPHSRRVLVVEDNRDTALSLRWVLEANGHQVEVAADGRTALATVLTFHPEVVLCDIGLPGGMDGYAVAAAIRHDAAYGSPYLIAVTGYGMPEDKARAREAGFDHFVTKAGDPRALINLVAELSPRA